MQIIRSLKHRNFRLFFFGQAFSLLGVWMQGPTVSWLVWRLTGSPKWLGAIGFASQVPILIFGLFAGVVADRVRRHRLVITIQTIAMAQALILAFLTLTGLITPPLIFVLSLFLGFVFAFDYPARQSFLMDMVGREDIGNAVALNSSLVHGMRVIGPVAAGFIVAELGEGACFTVNATSFLFVLTALFLMNKEELYPQVKEDDNHSVKRSIKEGLKLVWNMPEIRQPLIIMAVLSLAAMPYIVLLPQVVGERFGGTAKELGIAMSASGIGALTGAIYLATRKGIAGLYAIIKASLFFAGLGLVTIAFIPAFKLLLPVLALVGMCSFLVVAGTNTIMQTTAPPQFRGRIMSIFTVTFFGLTPIGSLVSGHVASIMNAHYAIAAGGLVCLIILVILQIRSKNHLINGSSTL